MTHPWIADRTKSFDSSGIRKVFDLAANMTNPINLSIGQPDFDVPEEVRKECINAIESGKNGYALTQGMPVLLEKLQAELDAKYPGTGRRAFVCSGTSGGLVLAMLALVNQGDEVIVFDPHFVMYPSLSSLVGGVPVVVDTYPDFRIDLEKVAAAITPKTKMIVFNSPGNPTGIIPSVEEVRGLAELAAERNIVLVSDEIYRLFTYDEPYRSPAEFNPDAVVIDGFSKSYAMTGWRLGYVHGPPAVIETMIKLQQYTFVCAPQPVQWAGAVAMGVVMDEHIDAYRRKRDMLLDGLSDLYDIQHPGGAFYAFPRVPEGAGTGTEFVTKAIENNVLIIPGGIFSAHDTHFRISYAVDDDTLAKGIEVLRKLA